MATNTSIIFTTTTTTATTTTITATTNLLPLLLLLLRHKHRHTHTGLLVVNVTWRGKTYVGTLMDATRHHWAPPRFLFFHFFPVFRCFSFLTFSFFTSFY
ncbi:hypothetical protein HELRODRAFT_84919 [Helobdella robusta]|uniref:Uncharacterized protein n=1 Tax=Helobdella robusta TaxID=6412 RepID=T1G5Q3_HELRO|nr:hypothetical protein HELRODRAFT_84919 [Helobdella robusta]ESN98164.1 hypothetical protein HELRODRAFT_84919 [Helobdella robusta]